ncbi:MAG TPA: response regulator [Azospirillum sp.]|nr:response regulator [Azospirillum sp.]
MSAQDLVEGLPDPVALIGADGATRAVNQPFIAAFRDVAAQFATARDFFALLPVHADVLPRPHGPGPTSVAGADGRHWLVGERRMADGGRLIWWRDITDQRRTADDLYAATLMLERSVSEHADDRTRLRAALEAAGIQAEEAVRAKARTLAFMSQEIRNPVAAIVDAVRPLLAVPLGPAERERVGRILQSVETLRMLVDDVAELARLESQGVRLESEPFGVETVVGSVLASQQSGAADRGMTLSAEIDPAVPATVVGDPAWLRHVLVELVGLAVREGDCRAVAVRVRRATLPDGRSGLRVAVVGAGAGLAGELQAWLTDGVPSLDFNAARQVGVRGLGLHVCRRIVGLMGGEMGVDCDAEGCHGVWFTAAVDLGDGNAGRPAPEGPALDILVVEDNPVNQRVNAWLLEKDGHRVTVVSDGRQAVRLAATGTYDAVLMDLDVPGLDGIAATRAIRLLDGPAARIPIVAITVSAQPEDIGRCRAAGMNDHLPKPVNPAALSRILKRLVVSGRGDVPAEGDMDAGVLLALEGVIGRDKVRELVVDFMARAAGLDDRLAVAHGTLDLPALAAAAADLKTMAGSVGLTGVYDGAVELERLCAADDGVAAVERSVALRQLLANSLERLSEIGA